MECLKFICNTKSYSTILSLISHFATHFLIPYLEGLFSFKLSLISHFATHFLVPYKGILKGCCDSILL